MSLLGAAVSLGPRKRPWHLRPLPTRAAGPNHVLLLSPKSRRAHASRHSQQKEMPLDQLHGHNGLAPVQNGAVEGPAFMLSAPLPFQFGRAAGWPKKTMPPGLNHGRGEFSEWVEARRSSSFLGRIADSLKHRAIGVTLL